MARTSQWRPTRTGSRRRVWCHFQPTVLRPRNPCSIRSVGGRHTGRAPSAPRACRSAIPRAAPDHRPAIRAHRAPSAVQRHHAEGPASIYPQIARSRDQRAHRYALGLALRLKGDVGRVTQAGMPAFGHKGHRHRLNTNRHAVCYFTALLCGIHLSRGGCPAFPSRTLPCQRCT